MEATNIHMMWKANVFILPGEAQILGLTRFHWEMSFGSVFWSCLSMSEPASFVAAAADTL